MRLVLSVNAERPVTGSKSTGVVADRRREGMATELDSGGGSKRRRTGEGGERAHPGAGAAAETEARGRRRRGSGQRGEVDLARENEGDLARGRELARGNLTNGAPAVGAPLVIFFYIAMAHQAEVRH